MGLGSCCLGLQFCLGLADPLQPAGAALQFFRQLVTPFALAVLAILLASLSSALRSRARISLTCCCADLSIRSLLIAMCFLRLARGLVSSSDHV